VPSAFVQVDVFAFDTCVAVNVPTTGVADFEPPPCATATPVTTRAATAASDSQIALRMRSSFRSVSYDMRRQRGPETVRKL
jgi:hypothetical protein